MNPSLIYHITSSLDGYIARPDGRLDWFDSLRQPDEEYSFQYFYSGIDALLMGRGTYEADEFTEAVETARSERANATANYLLGMPLLADYLEEGLEKLGHSPEEIVGDVM